jgi:carboxypeptidase C (cathepsin A)
MQARSLALISIVIPIWIMLPPTGWGEEVHPARRPDSPPAAAEALPPAPDSVSRHSIDIGGQRLTYNATAGTLPLTGAKGEPTAHVFYTAYALESAGGLRPISFVFNGGPGAASAFLHIGALGPRAVPFNQNGSAALSPVRVEDNPDTWLGFTDLVFIDAVATGYSRAVGGEQEEKEKFFGVQKDADAMGEIVRLYLTRTSRLLDPVFVVGESYGGFRAALLAKRLLRSGFDLRGLVLISPVIEYALIRGDELMLLPTALSLPSIAYAHFETTTGAGPYPSWLSEVENFARRRYLAHLAAGVRDDPEINEALARFTGLPIGEIARRHGRVSIRDFANFFRRTNDRVLSRYDGTVSVPVPRPAGEHHSDPILDYAVSVLAPAFVAYARKELGYTTDLPYQLLNRRLNEQWDYGSSPQRQGYAGALRDLQDARTQRPALRVMIAAGYADLVTPFAVSRYLIDQMEIVEGAAPVEMRVYRGGHMMYLRAPSRSALAADARAMFADAMQQRE